MSSSETEKDFGVTLRMEDSSDVAGVRVVNLAAFKDDAAARLVDALREAGKLVISLVAAKDRVIGHVAFSAIRMEPPSGEVRVVALGPLAVLPEEQRSGVGTRLVREGLRFAESLGYTHVVLLGGAYYHRFGFVPTPPFQIRSVYDAGDHFMILALTGLAMPVDVMMTYEPEFAESGC